MTADPLVDALPAVRAAFVGWCGPLVGGRAYWAQSPSPGIARPLIVIQSQDGGGAPVPFIGAVGWSGLIVVRCIVDGAAGGLAAAEALSRQVASAIPAGATLTVGAATYAATCVLDRPVAVPPAADAWTAALRYIVALHTP